MTAFRTNTKYHNIFNFLHRVHSTRYGDYVYFVQRKDVKKSIHVGDSEYNNGWFVLNHLFPDLMKSERPLLEEVLDNYRVLYYSGQLDIIVAYPLSVGMYRKLQFGAAQEYRKANRYPWYVGEELAGFVKSAGNFTEVLVRNAGHNVPYDQPTWAFDLITKFTRDSFQYPYGGRHEEDNYYNITSTLH